MNCPNCEAPMEDLKPGTVWPADQRWYCTACKLYRGVRNPAFCPSCALLKQICDCPDKHWLFPEIP